MNIHATVYIETPDGPPRLADALDGVSAVLNPHAVNQSLVETLLEPEVHRAVVVVIKVRDADVLRLLNRTRPTVRGTVRQEND
jgi:hypothetical protein